MHKRSVVQSSDYLSKETLPLIIVSSPDRKKRNCASFLKTSLVLSIAIVSTALAIFYVKVATTSLPKPPFDVNIFQQSQDQMTRTLSLVDRLQTTKCEILVFGLGRDTPFWHHEIVMKRKCGLTMIESDLRWWFWGVWYGGREIYDIVHLVHYKTLVADYKSYFTSIDEYTSHGRDKEAAWCDLKLTTYFGGKGSWREAGPFDVVLVDAPAGYIPDEKSMRWNPGRFQSLFEAADNINTKGKGGVIVVDDCERKLEHTLSVGMFGRSRKKGSLNRSQLKNSQCYFEIETGGRESLPVIDGCGL